MPTLALSTGSLHTYGLNRAWTFATEAGFDAVEVLIDARWDTRQPAYLRALAGQTELPVAALHTPFRPLKGFGDDYPACVRRALALAGEVGARSVVAHPELSDGTDYGHWLRKHHEELSPPDAPRLAIENLPLKVVNKKPRYKAHTVERVAAFARITFDSTHFATAGVDVLAAYEALWERVGHIHLSNFREGKEHRLPQDGELPLDRLLAALVARGYTGVVSVELHPDALGEGDDETVAARLRETVAFCRRHLGQVG
jgi:sugar phosphate isomerase/epimerase